MKIIIEEGASGLWYATTEDIPPYNGLLVAGRTLDELLDRLSPTIRDMREAAKDGIIAALSNGEFNGETK